MQAIKQDFTMIRHVSTSWDNLIYSANYQGQPVIIKVLLGDSLNEIKIYRALQNYPELQEHLAKLYLTITAENTLDFDDQWLVRNPKAYRAIGYLVLEDLRAKPLSKASNSCELQYQAMRVVEKFTSFGIEHGDPSQHNILINQNRIYLVDFEFAKITV